MNVLLGGRHWWLCRGWSTAQIGQIVNRVGFVARVGLALVVRVTQQQALVNLGRIVQLRPRGVERGPSIANKLSRIAQ